ncbi:YolD-like family protein [Cytobacillus sp. IB215665]|uniref:YolD-like family protein n=1 Tax=Cytobacillus sp. IB215665 TaxID=3097357 RepID=UPI002A1681A7|nr:YolD-like family protein [Cytobacillus sp. IB215665]MDX8364359.1 YolD-like family protein [Cytobacillus sp. IB215665]
MIRDRGTIKWVSMMLPEHTKLLRELEKNQHRASKPLLDEQRLEELNEMIHIGIAGNQTLSFSYYQNHAINNVEGNIHFIDHINKTVRIIDLVEKIHDVQLVNIVDIQPL